MIIPLKNIVEVEDIAYMRKDLLEALIRSVPLRNDKEEYPYKNSEIDIYSIESKGLRVGQKFVDKKKLLKIMGRMMHLFPAHATQGISKLNPVLIYGQDEQNKKAIALYSPPIIENNGSGSLLDGIHRSYICSA